MKRSPPAKIVYDDLVSMWRPGTTAAELCRLYLSFGPDPFPIPLNQDDPFVEFSAWTYAKERSENVASACSP
jgi:hypothetical protein